MESRSERVAATDKVDCAARPLMNDDMGASRIGGLGGSTPFVGLPERVDPADLGKQPHHLPDRQHDADERHADDQAVEARIGHEGVDDLPVEDEGHKPCQNQEDRHADQIDPRWGKGLFVHRYPALSVRRADQCDRATASDQARRRCAATAATNRNRRIGSALCHLQKLEQFAVQWSRCRRRCCRH